MTRPPIARHAFTLLEVTVAVGLLAVVTIIIASVFDTVGDTVASGRRVSNTNRFAARFERIIRADFDAILRDDGFLVIRNELTHDYAANPRPRSVPLAEDDVAFPADDDGDGSREPGRPRRIDEIAFFAARDAGYVSRRPPVHPERVARSAVARVYYGHGQRVPVDLQGIDTPANIADDSRYLRPRLDETNAFIGARLGEPSSLGTRNPNEFANEWALLRHVTLLARPTANVVDVPTNILGLDWTEGAPLAGAITDVRANETLARVADNTRQIQLQPAAQSIFRSVGYLAPFEIVAELAGAAPRGLRPSSGGLVLDPAPGAVQGEEHLARPRFTSGLTDIAVTDLPEIRAMVESPLLVENGATDFRGPSDVAPAETEGDARRDSFDRAWSPGPLAPVDAEEALVDGTRFLQLQQRWMLDGLPSAPFRSDIGDGPENTGFRVRFDDAPPLVLREIAAAASTTEDRVLDALQQADQEMLAAGVFLPRCTEFIVEWSYGVLDTRAPGTNTNYGRPLWYGLRRFTDRNDDRVYTEGLGTANSPDALLADIFGDEFDGADLHEQVGNRPFVRNVGSSRQQRFTFPSFLLSGNQSDPDNGVFLAFDLRPVVNNQATFVEPSLTDLVLLRDRAFGGGADSERPPIDPATATIAEYAFGYDDPRRDDPGVAEDWPWPRLIRITMRFVDESTPLDEQTFQIVFRLPERGES